MPSLAYIKHCDYKLGKLYNAIVTFFQLYLICTNNSYVFYSQENPPKKQKQKEVATATVSIVEDEAVEEEVEDDSFEIEVCESKKN